MTRRFRAVLAGLFGDRAGLFRDRAGSVLVYAAIAAPVLMGAAALSIDIGLWYANKRLAQSAADSAAMAGSLEIVRSGGDANQILAVVVADAANNGFSAARGDTITVNYPPISGDNVGSTDAVEVIVSRPGQRLLSQVLFDGEVDIAARAVAAAGINDSCVWVLNPTSSSSLTVTGTAQVQLNCGILVNSVSTSGLFQSGSGCIEASVIKVVGGYTAACADPPPLAGVTAFEDPLVALPAPAYGACDFAANITVNAGPPQTLTPGTYCGRITVNANATLNFDPGLYVLNGAALSVSGQGTVTGSDVSFYLTQNSGVPDAITISGGATVTLSADDGGPLPGILFYHDRDSIGNVTHRFTGGSDMELSGVLYFPSQSIRFSGGSDLNDSRAMIIADTVEFSGSSVVDLDDVTTTNPLLAEATLLE